jgi:hypothetical protein
VEIEGVAGSEANHFVVRILTTLKENLVLDSRIKLASSLYGVKKFGLLLILLIGV